MPEIENKKPIVPLYKNDMITAKEKDEITDWQSSLRENLNCARAIDNTLNSNFSDNRLDTDKVLDAVIKDYGAERVSHVLAAQIINNNWDGRYHNDVKAWAKEQTVRWVYERQQGLLSYRTSRPHRQSCSKSYSARKGA